MKNIIDLHVHSTASDGSFTPTQLVKAAKEQGIRAMALTDHDTTAGVHEAMAAAETADIELIPGIELSTDYEDVEIHVVGLFIDPDHSELCRQAEIFRKNRVGRNDKMVALLREHGFDITMEILRSRNPDSVITRGNVARYLVETGQISDVKTVFAEYIGPGCCCYVDRYKITPMEAVRLIHEAGGLAVLAHPCLYGKLPEEGFARLIKDAADAGLDGIEALYSLNKEGDEEKYRGIAAQNGFFISGGSDFHGASKPDISLSIGLGDLILPYDILENIKRIYAKKKIGVEKSPD